MHIPIFSALQVLWLSHEIQSIIQNRRVAFPRLAVRDILGIIRRPNASRYRTKALSYEKSMRNVE